MRIDTLTTGTLLLTSSHVGLATPLSSSREITAATENREAGIPLLYSRVAKVMY
jgi:hypothetical protein